MLFYKVTAILGDAKWMEENNDRRIKQERTIQLSEKTEEYNEKNKQGVYFFVANIGHHDIKCGIISPKSVDADKCTQAFLRHLGIEVRFMEVGEITFSAMRSLLGSANRNDFIEDDDIVLEQFGLDCITGYRSGVDYDDSLLGENKDAAALYAVSEKLMAEETLRPELDRIYAGKANTRAFGHPVHYMLEADNRDVRKDLYSTLLHALYANHRLKSRRYCYVDFKAGQDFSKTVYNALYKSCTEGTIIVRYHANDDSESDSRGTASGEMEVISTLCETMMKYRNQVLTVFCLPRACDRVKKIFFEYLGSVGIVEIKEDLADVEKAGAYLRMLCRERSIRPDKQLYKPLESDKQYLPDELRVMFEDWYNAKIKTSVFPQYKEVAVCRKEAVKEKVAGKAYDKLQEMIGLTEAKGVIQKALDYYKLQRVYKDRGIRQDRPAMHMVFTGNPGTAKTTVARLFAQIMRENGLLSKGHLVEVGRGDLVGRYVGWTAQIVQEKFKAARGGVLFIDEAYSLAEYHAGSYGDEAINTIVQEMENRREDLVVIFAGYTAEMEEFLKRNPGLRSRIAFHVPFADYTTEELCGIAKMIGKGKGITFTDAAIGKLAQAFDAARTQSDFGNGRYVRNLIELAKMNQASRILKMDVDAITDRDLTTIDDVDIELPAVKSEPKKHTIGFAS